MVVMVVQILILCGYIKGIKSRFFWMNHSEGQVDAWSSVVILLRNSVLQQYKYFCMYFIVPIMISPVGNLCRFQQGKPTATVVLHSAYKLISNLNGGGILPGHFSTAVHTYTESSSALLCTSSTPSMFFQ